MKIFATIRGTGLAALLAAGAMTVAAVQTANAEQTGAASAAPPRIAAKASSRDAGAQFDWLAKRNRNADASSRVVRASVAGRHGSGSWICSPAGFGKRSSCHRR
jgi:hypothetical protein